MEGKKSRVSSREKAESVGDSEGVACEYCLKAGFRRGTPGPSFKATCQNDLGLEGMGEEGGRSGVYMRRDGGRRGLLLAGRGLEDWE